MPPSSQPPGPVPLGPPPVVPQPGAYDFITNPEKPDKHLSLNLPGGGSTAMRALYAAGGLLVLLIIFVIIKGLFGGNNNFTAFVGVAQDQQELIHLVTGASRQTNITAADQNFAATAQLSLTSSRSALISYLTDNGQKVSTKVIDLKVSSATDSQLVNAVSAGTYDQTFQQIMKGQLTTYLSDLKQAYRQTSGKRGRALLNDDYNQAQLLSKQLNLASSQAQ